MKKLIALFLAALLLMTCAAAPAEDTAMEAPQEEETDIAADPAFTRLVVANPTPMRGDFFTDQWGNATSDIDVRDLLHGYNLVCWDGEEGMFTFDPSVVSGAVMTRDETGNHVFVIVLSEDLYYSDGARITAWDYAFSFLLSIAPEIADLGGRPLRKEHLLGYKEYVDGAAPLAGVKVITDDTLTVTIDHEFLPFFYEIGLLRCNPYPIRIIAPGVTVKDDGDGVYLANEDPDGNEPLFTVEKLRQTILDPVTGYLSHPAVVSGPYTLASFDGVTAKFEINPYFKGDREGRKPLIPTLIYTLADNETMIEKLADGEFGLINKAARADQIVAGVDRLEEARLSFGTYPRTGLSYIGFAGERETVKSAAVRQAIAYCFDRDRTAADYAGSFGLRVDGYFGLGQWMYGVVQGTIAPPVVPPEDENDRAAWEAYEQEIEEYRALTLDDLIPYAVDTAKASSLLDEDGWSLNGDGLREKDGVVLDLKLVYPEGNNIAESLKTNLAEHLAAVGIALTMEAVPMGDLLTMWYKQGEREADMIYLASNFDLVFDPSVHFDPASGWAYTNVLDDEMYNAAAAMRRTEPGDVYDYLVNWIGFQTRFNEILPMIPVYSNVYFDFYTDKLHEYYISESMTWSEAIIGAYLADEEPAEPGEEDEFDEFMDFE